jgi:phosphatidate phosphatase LPIN
MGPQEKKPSKKYAKTLRLTSDQLKQLDLKPGANSVTFSLSASGVVACTARIFVWDHTDSIVVSDIDGTITKYVLGLFWYYDNGSLLSFLSAKV